MKTVHGQKLIVNSMKIISLCLCAAVVSFLLLSTNAFAQKETPPEGGPPKAFVFPKGDTYELPNGMKVTLVQYGSIPKVAFQATIYSGTKDDAKGKKAVSEMTGAMLKEGTTTRTAEQIA